MGMSPLSSMVSWDHRGRPVNGYEILIADAVVVADA
jgi:hypothetical protein